MSVARSGVAGGSVAAIFWGFAEFAQQLYETKPPPRSIDELIDYTTNTQHVEPVTDERCAAPVDFAWRVLACVEINQCVGCTRQFFTKSFLGDDAAVLARSSGEEPASPRHRAGVASMAWRTTR